MWPYYCVDKITEDLKIPRFFRSASSPTALQFKLCCLGPVNPQYLVSWLCSLSKLLSIQVVLPRPVLLNTTEIQTRPIPQFVWQDSFHREQLGKGTQPRNEVLGIHWAQTAQFALKSSWRGNTTKKTRYFQVFCYFINTIIILATCDLG